VLRLSNHLNSIWTAKFTVSEFLKRLTERFWRRRYELALRGIRIFLVVSFFIVVIATLTECMPFNHFWQVVPDPGPKCRQGYAHLLSMGILDIITDILLVVFPIPIIMKSAMTWKRKFDLIALFSLSLVLIAITGARIPSVIERHGRQQYRTVFASAEILAATAVSNAVIIGSFLRDRGVKKVKKYKHGSTTDSVDRASSRRPTIATQQWGSDEDLIRDVGIRLAPELQESQALPRPAPIATPATPGLDTNWQFPNKASRPSRDNDSDLKAPFAVDPFPSPGGNRTMSTKRNVSFFDVGGLLEEGSPATSPAGNYLEPTTSHNTASHDFAISPQRKGSRALLSDLGGLLSQSRQQSSSSSKRPSKQSDDEGYELPLRQHPQPQSITSAHPPTGVTPPMLSRQETLNSLQDVGGLLDDSSLSPIRNRPSRSDRGSLSSATAVPSSPSFSRPMSLTTHTEASSTTLHPLPASRRGTQHELQDVGGLLSSD
jgi:hypothetical protein